MRGTVLLVHDDLGVRRSLGGFLEARGFKVLSATTGQEALGVLEEDLPRLLVIGVNLPLMSGWKLIEALAHYPDLSRIPRLLVNAGDPPAVVCARALALLETHVARGAQASDDGERTPAPAGPRPRRLASA